MSIKDMSVKEKLEEWVEQNPNGYLEKTIEDIASESGVSPSSVSRELYRIIARRDNCLPSDVIKKREKGKGRGNRKSLSKNQKNKITKLHNQGMEIIDISYIVKCSPDRVRKYLNP